MKNEENNSPGIDVTPFGVISIKEKVEAANYAIRIKGESTEDEDVSDIVGEVYGG